MFTAVLEGPLQQPSSNRTLAAKALMASWF